MLETFQEMYGKVDGAFWCAVRMYEKEGGIEQPHRGKSSVTRIQVILRDVGGRELVRYKLKELREVEDVEESSEGIEAGPGEGDIAEPEQLEDAPEGTDEFI